VAAYAAAVPSPLPTIYTKLCWCARALCRDKLYVTEGKAADTSASPSPRQNHGWHLKSTQVPESALNNSAAGTVQVSCINLESTVVRSFVCERVCDLITVVVVVVRGLGYLGLGQLLYSFLNTSILCSKLSAVNCVTRCLCCTQVALLIK
jgi:hypothetical protein